MGNSRNLSELETLIGYTFTNKELLNESMSHSSYVNERHINKINCNERLEFLGDAVLELVSSDWLFKKYPDIPEGRLSKLRASLVCEPALFECSQAVELGSFIRLGKGEDAGGGRNKPSVISDAFEALLGAVYLDGGIDNVRSIIYRFILGDEQIARASIENSKSFLQEAIQATRTGVTISYEVTEEKGPEHDKEFIVQVLIDGKVSGSGSGHNKKAAEKDAALNAIECLGLMPDTLK